MQIILAYLLILFGLAYIGALIWSLLVPTQANRHGIRWKRSPQTRAAFFAAAILATFISVIVLSNMGSSQ